MTKGELIDIWKGIPSDAVIYTESDHGQQPEQAYGLEVTYDDITKDDYYGEDLHWISIKPSTKLKMVTAIRIR